MASNMAEVCSAFQRCSVLSQVQLNRTKWVCSCGSRAREEVCRKAAPTRLAVTRSRSSMPPLRMRGCGELFQFPQRNRGRLPVRLNDAAVVHRDGEDRHGLGRGALEVEKDTGGGASTHHSPRSQSLTGHRMQV